MNPTARRSTTTKIPRVGGQRRHTHQCQARAQTAYIVAGVCTINEVMQACAKVALCERIQRASNEASRRRACKASCTFAQRKLLLNGVDEPARGAHVWGMR